MPIPNKTSFSALVVGATGATGRALVRELLRSGKWASVTTIGRREFQYLPSPTEEQTRKLKQVIVDFDHLENNKDAIQGHDSVFICLGTTIKAAGSQEAFRKVDYEYVMNVARLVAPPPPQPQPQQQQQKESSSNTSATTAAAVPVGPHVSLVSSMGADANSSIFYSRVKGETEEALKKFGFPRLSIFRPGLLMTDEREEIRVGEAIARRVFPYISWAFPKKYREISTETVAKAMRLNAERVSPVVASKDGAAPIVEIYTTEVIKEIAASEENASASTAAAAAGSGNQ